MHLYAVGNESIEKEVQKRKEREGVIMKEISKSTAGVGSRAQVKVLALDEEEGYF